MAPGLRSLADEIIGAEVERGTRALRTCDLHSHLCASRTNRCNCCLRRHAPGELHDRCSRVQRSPEGLWLTPGHRDNREKEVDKERTLRGQAHFRNCNAGFVRIAET